MNVPVAVAEWGNLWVGLAWAGLPALALLAIVWWVDRHEKEPLVLVLVALLGGAIGVAVIAALLELAFGLRTSLYGAGIIPRSELGYGTPIVEEAVRGLVILALFRLVRDELDGILDGVLYGAAIGVGVYATATLVSIMRTPHFVSDTASLFSSSLAGTDQLLYGTAIGAAATIARRSRFILAFAATVAGTAVATGLHITVDYVPWWTATTGRGGGDGVLRHLPTLLGLGGLAALMSWAVARERVIVERELSGEVAAGVVRPDEYAAVTGTVRRPWALLQALLRGGPRAWVLQRRLYGLEVELAFNKHRGRGSAKTKGSRDEHVYRGEISATRLRLRAALEPPG